jgi:hypothetical protein
MTWVIYRVFSRDKPLRFHNHRPRLTSRLIACETAHLSKEFEYVSFQLKAWTVFAQALSSDK